MDAGRAHLLRVWVKRPEGWKAIVYQEVMSLEAPPSFAPSAGKDCENPCKMIPYQAEERDGAAGCHGVLEAGDRGHGAQFGELRRHGSR